MAGFASVNANGLAPDTAWMKNVHAAFPPELQTRIAAAASSHSELPRLFDDLAQHVLAIQQRQQTQNHVDPSSNAKKRKLVEPSSQAPSKPQPNGAPLGALYNARSFFSCKDVSFQIPMRKKLKLDLAADTKSPTRQELRLVNQTSQETEYTLRVDQIEQAFCMTVPDKQARQANFVLYPKVDEGVEPVVFALNETPPGNGILEGADVVVGEEDTCASVVGRALGKMLKTVGLSLVKPTDAEFASAIPQSHRKGEKGYHVRAHRGSKEGYLFFLPTGIFFGFKKPLAFFPFAAIESISYTSVLQRTFNLVITTSTTSSGSNEVNSTEDIEFSMLDQADFAGIDEYVKRHGLNDASMAQERRAKAYNVNKVKGEEGQAANNGAVPGEVGEDGLTELQRAEQALQDAEDEEEEDYEASGGESDGEGEESEGEEGEEGEGEGEYDDEGDDVERDEM